MEQAHIIRAYRFELTKVQVPAIRERVVSQLVNVNEGLARAVAEGLGIDVPDAQPAVVPRNSRPEVKRSPALSLLARPGDGSIRTRRIALLVADGVDGASLRKLHDTLAAEGAVPRYVGPKLGAVETADGGSIDVEVSLEAAPSVLFDAVVLPDGDAAVNALAAVGLAPEFIKDQYRHCKPILALGAGARLLEKAGIPRKLPDGADDPGILRFEQAGETMPDFIEAIARHRHFERFSDPPRVWQLVAAPRDLASELTSDSYHREMVSRCDSSCSRA